MFLFVRFRNLGLPVSSAAPAPRRFGPPANFNILVRQQGIEWERLKSTSDEKNFKFLLRRTKRVTHAFAFAAIGATWF